jgi:hypothetical protein
MIRFFFLIIIRVEISLFFAAYAIEDRTGTIFIDVDNSK